MPSSVARLAALGLGNEAIEYRLRSGRLIALHRGVYAVGRDAPAREARWLAAVLASGAGGVLSHQAAAAHWGLRSGWRGGVQVTVPCQRRGGRDIELHRSPLAPYEITVHEGVPVTTVPRTVFDLAALAR